MKTNANGAAGGPPYLSYKGSRVRYTLSKSTISRLRKARRWPEGNLVGGRRVFSQLECDEAFRKLIAEQK